MKNGFRVMDSDMHIREPRDLWEKYLELEWRDRGPKIISETTHSGAVVLLDGKILKGYPLTRRNRAASNEETPLSALSARGE